MQPQHYLFIDDLDPKPVADLLSQSYPGTQIEHLWQKEAIRERLQTRSPEETVILLNAHIRFNAGDLRSNFLGMRLLRKELRTRWRRREAVIVYSPLRREVFLNIPLNRILCANMGHYYYHIMTRRSIFGILKEADPIISDTKLDEIIERYGCLNNLIRTFRHDIENKLPAYIASAGRYSWKNGDTLIQLASLVQSLGILIPTRFHASFQIDLLTDETQKLVEKMRQKQEHNFEAHLTAIQSILDSYNELCNQLLSSASS